MSKDKILEPELTLTEAGWESSTYAPKRSATDIGVDVGSWVAPVDSITRKLSQAKWKRARARCTLDMGFNGRTAK